MNDYDIDYKTGRKWAWRIFGILLLMGLITGVLSRACAVSDKLLDEDRAVSTYEDFHNMYQQAEQLCSDIAVMEHADSLSGGFSKQERILGLENKLNEVIRDYNAKSEAWTRNMWKDEDLPHTLNRRDFNCN